MATQTYPGKGLSLSQLTFALNEELKRTAHSPSFTFDDVSQLDRDVSTALANIREWRNSFIPINRVPLDVLSLVPAHFSSQKDLFRATFVCRHWRKTFLHHGTLWSFLVLKHGGVYAKTLLERAKGSALCVVASCGDPPEAVTALSPCAQQIRDMFFAFSHWKDIQWFSEVNSGPLPLLRRLSINVFDEFSLDHPNRMTPPSLPLFSNAINVKDFAIRSERFPFLGHFAFPNLTTFELSTTPALTSEPGYRALELLDFLEASPRLRTVSIKIVAGIIRLHDVPRERLVVLPDVDTFSLIIDDAGAGYELATRISCPSVKRTSLVHEGFNDNDVLEVIFPSPPSWNVISRQYTRIPIVEAALEMKADHDPIVSCSLAFRSPDATVLGLDFKLLRSEDDEDDDLIPYRALCRATFTQASRTIQDCPLLPSVKRLRIRYRSSISDFDELRHYANVFGRLLKSAGPLDVLSIYGCDPHVFLTPFLNLEEFNNMEEPIVYPQIKELKMFHLVMVHHKEECITAIVEFAKSQHARGIPFERVEFCMERLPTGIAERLRPWVGAVDCHESLCEEEV